MPSSESESSSESRNSPAPARKRRQVGDEALDIPDDHDVSGEEDSELDASRPAVVPSTEVLSHAERRRQKKKQKRQLAASASESPRKKRKLDDGTTSNTKAKPTTTKAKIISAFNDPGRQKRQNSIWVGNLSFWTTQDALRGFFDGVGTITRIHMPIRRGKEAQGENMGFAYVDFDTSDAKVIAITLSEGQLDGRKLLIKDGGDFTGRPTKAQMESNEEADGGEGERVVKGKDATTTEGKHLSKKVQKILRTQKQPPAPTLFLGNLGFETTEESIRELFEAHRRWGHKGKSKRTEEESGEDERQVGDAAKSKDVWIRKIRMGTFEDSGNCKGFAFVDFTSIEHATEALVNPRNHRLNGRDLVVEYASADAVRRGEGGPRRPKGDQDQKIKSGSGKATQKGTARVPNAKQHRPRHAEEEDGVGAETPVEATAISRPRRPERAGHDQQRTRRAKPGAVLAYAQRQSAAIVPSEGQKIVF